MVSTSREWTSSLLNVSPRMLNKLETHVRRQRCRNKHLDSSLYPWKPAEAGSGLSPGCGKLSSTANPLTSGERAAHENSPPELYGTPSPPVTATHSVFARLCREKEREMERERESMIMLIASDRGIESDYWPTIAHVTLYPVSEKNLARLTLRSLLDQAVKLNILRAISTMCRSVVWCKHVVLSLLL